MTVSEAPFRLSDETVARIAKAHGETTTTGLLAMEVIQLRRLDPEPPTSDD